MWTSSSKDQTNKRHIRQTNTHTYTHRHAHAPGLPLSTAAPPLTRERAACGRRRAKADRPPPLLHRARLAPGITLTVTIAFTLTLLSSRGRRGPAAAEAGGSRRGFGPFLGFRAGAAGMKGVDE